MPSWQDGREQGVVSCSSPANCSSASTPSRPSPSTLGTRGTRCQHGDRWGCPTALLTAHSAQLPHACSVLSRGKCGTGEWGDRARCAPEPADGLGIFSMALCGNGLSHHPHSHPHHHQSQHPHPHPSPFNPPPHPGAEHSWGCSHQFASPVRGRGSGLVIHTVYLLGSGVLQTTGEGGREGGGGRETSNGFITGKKHGSVGSALQLSWGMWCGALWAGAGAWPGPHCCCPPSSSTAVLLLPGVGAGPKGDRGAVGAEGRKGP